MPRIGPGDAVALVNTATTQGFPEVEVHLVDEAGDPVMAPYCERLGPGERVEIDPSRVRAGFRGSVLLRSAFWEHDQFDRQGRWSGSQLGLEAAVIPAGAVASAMAVTLSLDEIAPPTLPPERLRPCGGSRRGGPPPSS